MANNHRRIYCSIFGLILLLFLQNAASFQYRVGGRAGWRVPSKQDHTSNYSEWAARSRFQVGDSLLFVYRPGEDSVRVVNETEFVSCNTSLPVASSDSGISVFRFESSGHYYFISGVAENCKNGQKLEVIVMALREWRSSWTWSNNQSHTFVSPLSLAPSPSPSPNGYGDRHGHDSLPATGGASTRFSSLSAGVAALSISVFFLVSL